MRLDKISFLSKVPGVLAFLNRYAVPAQRCSQSFLPTFLEASMRVSDLGLLGAKESILGHS